jgi:hypothetical protein
VSSMPFHGRHGAALACALLLAVVSGVPAPAETLYGALYLSTLPTGANVWVDGTFVGVSPVLIDPLARGHHSVTLSKTGWSVQEVDVDVPSGTTGLVSFRLRTMAHTAGARPRGSVAFRGLAEGARVAVDGATVRRDPRLALPLAAGTHVAIISTPAGKVSRTFTVYPDVTTQVLLSEVVSDEGPRAIVAPAQEFLPDGTYSVDGKKVVVRYGGHQVVARLGELPMRFDGVTVSYDAAPSRINGRLYLPLALLTRLTEAKAK